MPFIYDDDGCIEDVTKQEVVMVRDIRRLSEHSEVKLTASLENGVWECELIRTHHPAYLYFHPDCPPNAELVERGVGTTFAEAFNALDGNDVEPAPTEDELNAN